MIQMCRRQMANTYVMRAIIGHSEMVFRGFRLRNSKSVRGVGRKRLSAFQFCENEVNERQLRENIHYNYYDANDPNLIFCRSDERMTNNFQIVSRVPFIIWNQLCIRNFFTSFLLPLVSTNGKHIINM